MQLQSMFQLYVKESTAAMWANVLARQPAASGGVQDTQGPQFITDNNRLIYMKKKVK